MQTELKYFDPLSDSLSNTSENCGNLKLLHLSIHQNYVLFLVLCFLSFFGPLSPSEPVVTSVQPPQGENIGCSLNLNPCAIVKDALNTRT